MTTQSTRIEVSAFLCVSTISEGLALRVLPSIATVGVRAFRRQIAPIWLDK